MTLPHHPSRRLIAYTLKTTPEILSTAETLCKLKCKIKHRYQDTLKLNFSLWPNLTRPDPPFPAIFLTRPGSGQESCNSVLDIVWVSLQGHRSVSHYFFLQSPQCPCSVRKWFSRDQCCRGRSKPGTNRAWRRVTTLIETNVLLLSQTGK